MTWLAQCVCRLALHSLTRLKKERGIRTANYRRKKDIHKLGESFCMQNKTRHSLSRVQPRTALALTGARTPTCKLIRSVAEGRLGVGCGWRVRVVENKRCIFRDRLRSSSLHTVVRHVRQHVLSVDGDDLPLVGGDYRGGANPFAALASGQRATPFHEP